jgi:F0F1-type ATP synthase membrane subunit c/vacuolar-type H+-ATPase subunit K
MKKWGIVMLACMALFLLTPAVFAQTGTAETAGSAVNWVAIAAGFSMAIASAAGGYAQAKASAAASESIARNPSAAGVIQNMLILALVLIESMALYVFAIIFLKVK